MLTGHAPRFVKRQPPAATSEVGRFPGALEARLTFKNVAYDSDVGLQGGKVGLNLKGEPVLPIAL